MSELLFFVLFFFEEKKYFQKIFFLYFNYSGYFIKSNAKKLSTARNIFQFLILNFKNYFNPIFTVLSCNIFIHEK